jgi:hypothetical protein
VVIGDDSSRQSEELFENLHLDDPEFEDWLRDIRQQHLPSQPDHQPLSQPGALAPKPTFYLRTVGETSCGREHLAIEAVKILIVKELLVWSGEDVVFVDADTEIPTDTTLIELRSHTDGGNWHLFVRLLFGPNRACYWTDHLRTPLDIDAILASAQTATFISQAVAAMCEKNPANRSETAPLFTRVSKAAMLLFSGEKEKIAASEIQLRDLVPGDDAATIFAWRSFARLTQVLEFAETGHEPRQEALAMAEEAVFLNRSSAVAPALAAITNLKLNGDVEYAHYLADKAIQLNPQNPYAMNALSQTRFFRGEYEQGYELSTRAQKVAQGLRNGHYWDIQACLAALGMGKTREAMEFARSSLTRWPKNRPTLRYLVALSILSDNWEAARRYGDKLRGLEPGFTPASLLRADYPVETLRRTGLVDDLRLKIGS